MTKEAPIVTNGLPNTYYIYTTESGQKIQVIIIEDCGMVNGFDKQWHKVLCKPIGFNNSPTMILDFNWLVKA